MDAPRRPRHENEQTDEQASMPTLPESAMGAFGESATLLRSRRPEDQHDEKSGFALVIYAGSQLGRLFPLQAGENLIGRSPAAAITLPDEEVSRHHARLRVESRDRLVLEDLGSTNGTFVNGQPLKKPLRLKQGDRIALGNHVLKVLALDHLERRFHETLLDQSTKDPLTGVANRGTILSELQNRFDLSHRHGRALSIVMGDLDHFKQINDTFGHGAGDQVLTRFGEILRQNMRGTDVAGRIGGEEFLLVLPETEREGAMLLAERLRNALASASVTLQEQAYQVTCSLGVAERHPEDRDAGTLLARADAALYQAKAEGRNRVIAGEFA
ncbi:MAG: GGDEF domain-containing protein [Firmicutes bacterium]|nr:GGDEF domain-containing protein [Bacillota bacterium]